MCIFNALIWIWSEYLNTRLEIWRQKLADIVGLALASDGSKTYLLSAKTVK